MPAPKRPKKFALRRHLLSEDALRESLRVHSQWVPVFIFGGVVLDGKRRQRLCRELGRTPHTVELRDKREAARVLFVLHPVEAVIEFCSDMPVLEASEFLGVQPSDFALIRRELQKMPAKKLGDWRPNYKRRFDTAQKLIARVRQGLDPLTVTNIEKALRLPQIKPKE
jgi:hypothetical protein